MDDASTLLKALGTGVAGGGLLWFFFRNLTIFQGDVVNGLRVRLSEAVAETQRCEADKRALQVELDEAREAHRHKDDEVARYRRRAAELEREIAWMTEHHQDKPNE